MVRKSLGAALVWMLGVNACAPAALASATVTLPRTRLPVTVEGGGLSVELWGTATIDTTQGTTRVTLAASADLRELQARVPALVQARLAKSDDCDQVVKPHTVSLKPNGRRARFSVAAHFEQWTCPTTDLFGTHISAGKHKLLEQDGEVSFDLVPEVSGGTLTLRTDALSVNANGLLGRLLSMDGVGAEVRDQVRQALPTVLAVVSLKQLLPPELSSLEPKLEGADFCDLGDDTLGLRATASLPLDAAQAADLARAHAR